MSFARFMELALYCPGLGYYEQAQPQIGRPGHFYTNVSVGCLFGQLLAFQFAQWLDRLPADHVQLVEAGAHDGQLAADMLAWLRRHRPSLLDRLEYWVIEPSMVRQASQRARLAEFAGQIRWRAAWDQLPHPVQGVVFSNELLDALPVRRLGWDAQAQGWFEWLVDFDGRQFIWRRGPLPEPQATALLQSAGLVLPPQLAAVLPDGFTLDLCPAAAQWWQQAAQALGAGWLVTIDYGLTADELLRPERPQGTLRAYYRHHLAPDPLAHVGQQDLTAHVNFTQLQAVGGTAGLQTLGLWPQWQFLTRIAQELWAQAGQGVRWPGAFRRQFQTLTHPDHLGRAFWVLVQARSATAGAGGQSGTCNSQLSTAKQ